MLHPESLPQDEAQRVLASIEQIHRTQPHPNGDRMDLSFIKGWQVATQRGEFKAGDLVVFLEVDAQVPPETPWAEMLRRYNWRVKTIKLRGELSQGLALPLSVLNIPPPGRAATAPAADLAAPCPSTNAPGCPPPEGEEEEPWEPWDLGSLTVGLDVTCRLRITKHEPPLDLDGSGGSGRVGSGSAGPPFPSGLGIRRTEELRAQSHPKLLTRMAHQPWVATLKIDGASFTCFWDPRDTGPDGTGIGNGTGTGTGTGTGAFVVCSRNLVCLRSFPVPLKEGGETDERDNRTVIDDPSLVDAKYITDAGAYWEMVYQYRLASKLADPKFRRYCLQGEVYGCGISGNRLRVRAGRKLAVFNVYDFVARRYLPYDQMVDVLTALDVPMVPVVAKGDSFDLKLTQLLDLAQGTYEGTKNPREGLVVRSRVDAGLSFKVINNDYLLAEK